MKTRSYQRLIKVLAPGLFIFLGVIYMQTNSWKVPPEADKLTSPLQNNAEAAKSGKKLYSKNCVVCHGDQGKGDGMAAVSLHPHPTNLVSQKVEAQSDGAIFWKISEGHSPMPGYKNTLTEEQRWQLVCYIRTLQAR